MYTYKIPIPQIKNKALHISLNKYKIITRITIIDSTNKNEPDLKTKIPANILKLVIDCLNNSGSIDWSLLDTQNLSDFQLTVYKALAKISAGKTISYQELAKKIGKPKAARAVGNALNKNPFPIVIPCHRVVKSNGEIGGFAAGIKTKKALLKKERENPPSSDRLP
jgi:O-6-methylguanine DNA methyltransferase